MGTEATEGRVYYRVVSRHPRAHTLMNQEDAASAYPKKFKLQQAARRHDWTCKSLVWFQSSKTFIVLRYEWDWAENASHYTFLATWVTINQSPVGLDHVLTSFSLNGKLSSHLSTMHTSADLTLPCHCTCTYSSWWSQSVSCAHRSQKVW